MHRTVNIADSDEATRSAQYCPRLHHSSRDRRPQIPLSCITTIACLRLSTGSTIYHANGLFSHSHEVFKSATDHQYTTCICARIAGGLDDEVLCQWQILDLCDHFISWMWTEWARDEIRSRGIKAYDEMRRSSTSRGDARAWSRR